MGGSSGQVTGYKYLTNFLLFIGNPIESLIGINFDKRLWITGKRVPMGDNGTMIYLHSPNLYGENEGGVSGTLCLKLGTNTQTPDAAYKKYMESIGLQASAYPCQSYISFSGGELLEKLESLTDDQLQELADQHNDGIIPGRGFYVGNSGYMKEMLLWPKRTRIRNDGRRQWYETREDGAVVCEIGSRQIISNTTQSKIYNAIFTYKTGVTTGNNEISYGIVRNEQSLEFEQSRVAISAGGAGGSTGDEEEKIKVGYKLDFSPASTIKITIETSHTGSESVTVNGNILSYKKTIKGQGELIHEYVVRAGYFEFIFTVSAFGFALAFIEYVTIESYPFGYIANNEHPDINPIHKIREIFTDDTAMNKPEFSVNNDNFIKAADRIYDEGLGVSWSITEKSCIDAINELCYHIEAGIRVNRQTGLYEMVLFRDDWFEEDEIHVIAESKIKSMQYEITNADEVINQVNVNYYDRANIKNSSFSISESGLIQTLGRVNAETLDFPYFMNMRNAEIVANWKLKQLSTGAFKGSFTTGWREARKWNRYDLIRLPWSKRWTGTILVRIMSINLGGPTNNEVSIEFIEVVPATGMMNTNIVIDDPIDKPLAPQPCNAKVFELPYFEAVQAFGERNVNTELADNPEVGYLCAIAEKPQNNSLNAALHVDSRNGFERAATINYCETAYLDRAIDRISSAFTVKNVGNITSVRIGSQIFINDEIMVYQSYDTETKVLTAKRGAFGIPQAHAADSILYFADDFVAVDQTIYVQGEIVSAKALTTTPSGVLDLEVAVNHDVEMKARAIRPYPPANVKINGIHFPETQIVTNNIVMAWAHRNRLQQTGGEIIGWYEGNVTAEDGVTYSYELVCENVILDSRSNISANTVTILASLLKPNKPHKLKLWSVRDGYESYQKFEHSFFIESVSLLLTATALKDKVTGNTVPVANISVSIDESLKANMKFDGSSLSGKAPAGAIITIEVQE